MTGIIEYGAGNIRSVVNACRAIGFDVTLVDTADGLMQASRIILPGVGSFRVGMENLQARGLVPALHDAVTQQHKPLLGICLGMQLLADCGTEGGDTEGLGFVPGDVVRMDDSEVRIPHVGWNSIHLVNSSPLLDTDDGTDFYFVHGYSFRAEHDADVLATCDYGATFPCAVGRDNVLGVQFHPEKSHQFGLRLLRRFLESAC
ncbi:MAG: imidazole glycerol phosphate synthase subunit HisH [Lentisphaeria bacterium]|nr:imidazole glycerol phosphate synthase subunit HisH [Lentisphaeria bacterium]